MQPVVAAAEPWQSGCALVTGASRGIGAAIAEALAADGWPVGVNFSRDEVGAAETVARIAADGGRARAVAGDVADQTAIDAMFATLEEEHGRVLVLVNNAGIRADQLVAMQSDEDFNKVLDVNLTGAFRAMRRGLGPMLRARFGRVINISSVSAGRPLPGQVSYSASKAAVEAMTKTAAVEVARRGITVNAVAPGLVATDMTADMDPNVTAGIPFKRAAEPREVAACVRFLASPAASYVTGSVLTVDGGLTAGTAMLVVNRGG